MPLPPQWATAYERDRQNPLRGNDPLPERRAARALSAFIATGLVFVALPGTLLGVWNLLAITGAHGNARVSPAWIQAHGQAQLFGWVGTFILGISLYVLPKFLESDDPEFRAGLVGLDTLDCGNSVAVAGRCWPSLLASWIRGIGCPATAGLRPRAIFALV